MVQKLTVKQYNYASLCADWLLENNKCEVSDIPPNIRRQYILDAGLRASTPQSLETMMSKYSRNAKVNSAVTEIFKDRGKEALVKKREARQKILNKVGFDEDFVRDSYYSLYEDCEETFIECTTVAEKKGIIQVTRDILRDMGSIEGMMSGEKVELSNKSTLSLAKLIKSKRKEFESLKKRQSKNENVVEFTKSAVK